MSMTGALGLGRGGLRGWGSSGVGYGDGHFLNCRGTGGLNLVGFLWTLEFVSWGNSNVNPVRVLWLRGGGEVGELFLVV